MRIPKIRYLVGIPYLFYVGYMGGEIFLDAMVLGVASGITDFFIEGGGNPPLGG